VSAARETGGERDFGTQGLSDGEVFAGFLRADPDLAAEFVRRYEGPLYAYIRRMTPGPTDVQALLQETFLRAFRLGSSFSARGTLKAWLYKVARTVCYGRTRGAMHVGPSLEELSVTALSGLPAPDCAAESRERGARIRAMLALLSPDQQEAVILKYYEGLTFEELAQVVSCPVATAKSRVRLALAVMKPWLKRFVESDDMPRGERREEPRT
jgi:RNA polymerase sigma-70 factor (ECF subfamily)